MALSDWTVFKDGGVSISNPLGIVFTDLINPIVGAGSVILTHDPTTEFQSINLIPSTLPKGFPAGRIQTLIRFDDIDGTSAQENHAGLLCMQNNNNMAKFSVFGGTGKAYGLSVSVGEGGSPQSVNLWKFTGGIDGSSGSLPGGQLLSSVALPFVFAIGEVIALELLWRAEPEIITQVGGVLLKGRIGQTLDFSDLQEVINFVDSTSPYTSTVAEGIWAGFKNEPAGDNRVSFDKTSLVRIVLN
jgi:hypothetical protein